MTAMRDEIGQQAQIVAAMAADTGPFEAAAAEARAAGARFVLYAARGTSDNAAVYGKYLATIAAGLPCGLAVPCAATVYGAHVDLRDCLVIGISQSGETPDVAEYLARARAAGAFTLAITNERDSTLAGVGAPRAAHRAPERSARSPPPRRTRASSPPWRCSGLHGPADRHGRGGLRRAGPGRR